MVTPEYHWLSYSKSYCDKQSHTHGLLWIAKNCRLVEISWVTASLESLSSFGHINGSSCDSIDNPFDANIVNQKKKKNNLIFVVKLRSRTTNAKRWNCDFFKFIKIVWHALIIALLGHILYQWSYYCSIAAMDSAKSPLLLSRSISLIWSTVKRSNKSATGSLNLKLLSGSLLIVFGINVSGSH